MSKPPACCVCGVGDPERPNAQHPVCHPCRCAVDRYRERTLQQLEACERGARARLHLAVVNLRRVHAAKRGLASIGTYQPQPEHRGVSTP